MGETISTFLKTMAPPFWWVLTKTGQAFRCAVTKTGQAVKWVVTKTGQVLASLVARLYNGFWKLGWAVFSTSKGFLGGGVSGKPRSPGSAVYSDSGGLDYRIDIPVDDEHQVIKGSPVSEDEPKSADVVTKSSTLPAAVPEVEKSAGVAGESSAPLLAVPEVTPKHQLVVVKGPTIGEGEEKSADVAGESSLPPVAVLEDGGKSVGIACGSSALPMAVPVEPPNSSYKQVVKQLSPVMFDNLSTLSEPKLPRFGKLGRYDGGQRILLVGEGDFSFSACLAAAFGDASNMVATSHDTFDFLKKSYKRAPENIEELKRRGCDVIHQVDATKMANHPKLCSIKFDRIIYNFPYWGLSDVQISYHQSLVLGFIESAKEMMGRDGEIHITHKSSRFSNEWNIVDLESSAGLELIRAVKLKLRKYPAYYSKYGPGGDQDFDCHPSKTYKLKLAPKKKSRGKR